MIKFENMQNKASNIFPVLLAILFVLLGNNLRADGYVDDLGIAPREDGKLDITARGWAASNVVNDALISVDIFLDKKLAISSGIQPEARPDVASATGHSDWVNSGWQLKGISPDAFTENKYAVTAVAHFASGAKTDLIYQKSVWGRVPSQSNKPARTNNLFKFYGFIILILVLLVIFIIIRIKRNKNLNNLKSPLALNSSENMALPQASGQIGDSGVVKTNILNRFSTWIVIILIMGLVYVANAWSPSSYACALNWIGADVKPTFGSARGIRSDEWAARTPLTQALVNNGFARYNTTSIYKEDLRINYGLPIFDWGLIFKPACWGYSLLPPAYAFSFYYYFLFSIFVIGYALLFSKLGLGVLESMLISCALYFSGTVQFWWTSGSEIFAYFPWVFLLIYETKTKPLMAIPLFWLLVCWQLSNFYPPFTYVLGLVGVAWLWMVNGFPRNWKSIGAICISSCLAVAIVVFYLRDYLHAMGTTSYPGFRNFQGGTAASWFMLPSHFFPTLLFGTNYHLMSDARGGNICESGTWATLLPLMMIFFCNGNNKGVLNFIRSNWLSILIMLLMIAWLVLPIPAGVARFIGLNQIQPNRLMAIFGLLFTMVLISYGRHVDWQLTYKKLIQFWGVFILVIVIYKMNWPDIQADVIAAFVTALVMALCIRFRRPKRETALVGIALFAFLRFAPFNPVQSAKPIFSPPHVGLYNAFEDCMKTYGYVNLPSPGVGAVINGLGFPSVAHTIAMPQLKFWIVKFANLDPTKREFIFNRYAHIQVTDEDTIRIGAPDAIFVPRKCFMTPNEPEAPCPDVKN